MSKAHSLPCLRALRPIELSMSRQLGPSSQSSRSIRYASTAGEKRLPAPPSSPKKKKAIPDGTVSKPASSKAKDIAQAQPATPSGDMINRLAHTVRQAAPSIAEPYQAFGACEILVKECARVADYTIPQRGIKDAEVPLTARGEELGIGKGWWYEKFGLLPTFNTWAQITLLHMYLLTVRMRMFPAASLQTWNQQLTDHFFYMAEDRMVTHHNIASKMLRNRYLKDLFEQNRGLTFAYDEGISKGDAVLAAAVWRNVCKGDEDVDLKGLAMVVSYTRSVLSKLESMGDEVIADGDIVFGDPGEETAWVLVRSRALDPSSTETPHKAPVVPVIKTRVKSAAKA